MQDKFENIINFLNRAELVKSVLRHSWTSSGRQESSAEHSWRLAILAMVLDDEFCDLDMRKVIEMVLIHDLGEAYAGDYPAFKEMPKDKYKLERDSLVKVVNPLSLKLQNKIISLWEEFHQCKTKEAKFAMALDKIEAVIQHNEADIDTWEPEEYNVNLIYGDDHMKHNDFLVKLREAVKKQTQDKISDSK